MSTTEQHLMEQMKTGLDVADRTLYLIGEIDDAVAYKAIVGLRKLDKTDGDIHIVLNSGGGGEYPGFAIYDAICLCRNKVVIDGVGFVGSIAAAVFMAGDVRRMTVNAEFMIHNGSIATNQENIEQDAVLDLAEHIEKINKKYHSILAAASKMSMADVKKACEEETFYSAEEAVQKGFADEIIQPKKRRNTKRSRSK